MNKKQLIVTWIAGILLAISFIIFPYTIRKEKLYRRPSQTERANILKSKKPGEITLGDLFRATWTGKYKVRIEKRKKTEYLFYLLQIIPPVLIIGGLLIYGLRDKKK